MLKDQNECYSQVILYSSYIRKACQGLINFLLSQILPIHCIYWAFIWKAETHYSGENAYLYKYTYHIHILLSYREVVSICMRLPFAPLGRATQQIICRMELMLTRILIIFKPLPVKSIYILTILLQKISYLKIRGQWGTLQWKGLYKKRQKYYFNGHKWASIVNVPLATSL